MSACERACVYVLDEEKDGTTKSSVCVLFSTVMWCICICLATNSIPLMRS